LQSSTRRSGSDKGAVIIYGGGWHRREMFFVAKILLTIQKFNSKIKNLITQPQISIKK
jgi:hypothetical protein